MRRRRRCWSPALQSVFNTCSGAQERAVVLISAVDTPYWTQCSKSTAFVSCLRPSWQSLRPPCKRAAPARRPCTHASSLLQSSPPPLTSPPSTDGSDEHLLLLRGILDVNSERSNASGHSGQDASPQLALLRRQVRQRRTPGKAGPPRLPSHTGGRNREVTMAF